VTVLFLCKDTRENVYTEFVLIISDFTYLDVMVYQFKRDHVNQDKLVFQHAVALITIFNETLFTLVLIMKI
jgi:hypothetical protein